LFRSTVQWLLSIGALIRNSFDWLVDYAIDTKLAKVLTTMRIAHLCRLIESKFRRV
jgi:hypothetical protein